MKFLFKKTKIVSTFGPSVTSDYLVEMDRNDPEVSEKIKNSKALINDLFFAGVNCVRFNFSHGAVGENSGRIQLIREVQKDIVEAQIGSKRKYLRVVSLLADTKGPEIRVFDMTKSGVSYKMGQIITVFCNERRVGSEEGFSVIDVTGTYNMANDCLVGNLILVEDGKLTLEIVEVDRPKGLVKAKVKNTYLLKTNKRINLPGADYSMDFLSEKDAKDIKYSIDNGFEFIALSFVNSAKNVRDVKAIIDSYCKEKGIPNTIKVYSKIETLKSCENIDEIIEASDGIMIARGDLGLEIPYYSVPFWTKQIIRKCRKMQKPVITATQMLDSLERNIVATRAEVSDVYRAAEMGSDCTMLSGETAQGMFPLLSVETMTNIVFESEKYFNSEKFFRFFKEDFYGNYSPELRAKCDDLIGFLNKNQSANISALVALDSDLGEDFIQAFSSMRFSIPLFQFVPVSRLLSCCEGVMWDCPCFKKHKKAMESSLHRSINSVLVEGEISSETLPEAFKEFLGFYGKGKKCSCSCDSRKIAYFDGKNWKLSDEG